MIFLPVLVASSVVYAGVKARQHLKNSKRFYSPAAKQKPISPELQNANRNVVISSASLGLATAGVLLRTPVLGIASVPIMLYVFAPTIKAAWQHIYQERKINVQVLIATRVGVCVVMGYTFIAALDAVLQSSSQRFFMNNEEEFRRLLRKAYDNAAQLPDGLEETLEQAAFSLSQMQQVGERDGERTAPWMLASFMLTIPMMGVNRSAAFLTTTFGAHLHRLGPYTVQKTLLQAVQKGIFITQAGALERAMQVDTIIFDERIFHDYRSRLQATEVIKALRQRYVQDTLSSQPLTLYMLINHDDEVLGRTLVAELGLDGYFSASSGADSAELISNLQNQGLHVCYMGSGQEDTAEIQTALLAIAYPNRSGVDTAYPHIILQENSLQQLPEVFDLAAGFASKQSFNYHAPIGVDLVDISTTLFLDFGLIYSVLFTYTGLLIGVTNTLASED